MKRTVMAIFLLLCVCDCFSQTKSRFNTIGGPSHKREVDVAAKDTLEVVDEEDLVFLEDEFELPAQLAVALPLKEITVTSGFGTRKDPINRGRLQVHQGIDLRAKYEPVYSMLPGEVLEIGHSSGGGYYVKLQHGVCVCTYMHLSKILVSKGWHIRAGEQVAVSGNSGRRTTGPHLHISCRISNEDSPDDGKYFNPLVLLGFVYNGIEKGEETDEYNLD